MDLRLGPTSRVSIFPGPQAGLRAAIDRAREQAKDRGPKAEAAAARLVERTRPAWSWLATEWRRVGTAAAALIIVAIIVHALFGANGMVAYRQKHNEMQTLQTEVERLQKENSRSQNQINSLKSDPAAIEKEAREQLHYTRRGEIIYVSPDPPAKPPVGRAKNGK